MTIREAFRVADGRVLRDGRPFCVLGVNYHPARAACRIWSDWDAEAIERDFADIAAAGLNTVRLFLFWRDLQPEPEGPDEERLRRVRHVVAAARDRGLACVLSLMTIWMNGQRLDPAWRHGRGLVRDPWMLEVEERYVRGVARTLRDLDNVLALDLGDEVGNVAPAELASLSAGEVRGWGARLARAIHEEAPRLLVMQANDASGVLGSSPFGPDTAQGLDLAAVHGFPVWAPGSIESTGSFKATNLVPFLVRFAAAFGVPLVDELGSYGADDETSAAYLGAAAASALANGAAGVMPWCWQDVSSTDEPYRERPAERCLGLRRPDGTARPQLAAYQRVAGAAGDLAALEREPAPVALYLPERVRHAGGTYLDPGAGTTATFFAYLLLKRAHLPFDVVAGDLGKRALVVCPSVRHLTLTDLERLAAAAHAGATVYVSVGDHLHGFPGTPLSGVEVVDFSLVTAGRSAFIWEGERWPVDWRTGGGRSVTLRATGADVLAAYRDGAPAITSHRRGAGRVVLCAAPLEQQLDRPCRLEARPWERLYQRLAALAGVLPDVGCGSPAVEVVVGRVGGCRRAVLVNHAAVPERVDLTWQGAGGPAALRVDLDPKEWRIVDMGT